MKVLQVINSLNTGGAEKLILETVPLYNKKGLLVDVLLLNGDKYPFLEELEKLDCCTIYRLSIGTVYNPFLVFKIIPFLKKYDVIHTHLFPALYWVAIAKQLSFSNSKLVFTEHNTDNKRRKSILFKRCDRYFYKYFGKIITISKEVERHLKRHLNFSDNYFQCIQNGVNRKSIIGVSPYSNSVFFSENDKVLIQVSSFTNQKDQNTLIKSLQHLPNHVKLLLVGDGALKSECEELVQVLQLNERVQFLGIRMDVPRLLKTADIVVLSSYYEGLSLSCIEALTSGKPFIASDVPGLRDVVKGAGLLFPVGHEKELAKHIIDLLNDKQYYTKVANACFERSKEYDIGIMVKKHIDLYNSLILEN